MSWGSEADPSMRTAAQQLGGEFPEIAELRSDQHPGITLIRPDGYIASSTPNGDGPASLRSLRFFLERQTSWKISAATCLDGETTGWDGNAKPSG